MGETIGCPVPFALRSCTSQTFCSTSSQLTAYITGNSEARPSSTTGRNCRLRLDKQRQRRDEWIDWLQSLLNPASSAPPAAPATMEEDGRAPSKQMTRRRNGRSSTIRKSKEVYGQKACPYCLLEGDIKMYAAQQGSAHLASHLFEIREKEPACPVCSETMPMAGLFGHLEEHGFALSGSATDKINGEINKVYSHSSGDTRAKKEFMAWVTNGCLEDAFSPPQAKKRKVAAGPSHSVASSARPPAAGPSGCAASLARSATAGPTAHTNTALRPLSACRGGRPQPNYRLSSASDADSDEEDIYRLRRRKPQSSDEDSE